MRNFLTKWYGERCPVWTWPATMCGFAVIMLTVAFISDYAEEQRCIAKGGNKSVASGCYSVVETKIY